MPVSNRLVLAALLAGWLTPAIPSAAPPGNHDRFGDSLPVGAVARCGSIRFRIPPAREPILSNPTAPVFSPDGRLIAVSGRRRGHIDLLDAVTGKPLRRLPLSGVSRLSEGPAALAFSPSGKSILVRPSDNHALEVYDLASGRRLIRIDEKTDYFLPLGAFDARSDLLAAVEPALPELQTLTVGIYDLKTGKRTGVIHPMHARTVGVTLSAESKLLATWDARPFIPDLPPLTNVLQLWDPRTCKEVRQIKVDENLSWVAFRPDGKELAVATWSAIHLFDAQTGLQRRRFVAAVARVDYFPDGRKLLAFTGTGQASMYDLAAGKRTRLGGGHGQCPDSVVFLRDGRVRACRLMERRVVAWDVRTGKRLSPHDGHMTRIEALQFTRGGRLLTASRDGELLEWERDGRVLCRNGLGRLIGPATSSEQRARVIRQSGEDRGEDNRVLFSPGGRFFAGPSRHEERRIALYDLATGEERLAGLPPVHLLRFSRDESRLLTYPSTHGMGVQIIRTDTGEELTVPKASETDVETTALSPDGRLLACSVLNGSTDAPGFQVRLCQVDTGKPVAGFRAAVRPGAPRMLQFSDDGRYLFGADCDPEVFFLLDARSGALAQTIRPTGNLNGPVLLCSRGRMAAFAHRAADGGQSISLHELTTGRKRVELRPDGRVTALAFSSDGRFLASGQEDGTALLWDLLAPEGAPTQGKPAELWNALQGEDAAEAWRAMRSLLKCPEQAVQLARRHVRPADGKPLSAAEAARLIAQLDDDNLTLRQSAQDVLRLHRASTAEHVKNALANKVSPEARRRLQQLLQPSPDVIPRALVGPLRAVELLEQIATTGTRNTLERLANGDSGSLLTVEAKIALVRLRRKGRER